MDSYNNKSSYDEFEAKAETASTATKGGKMTKERVIELLKKPKNLFILIGTLSFLTLLAVKLLSSKPKDIKKPAIHDDSKIPQASNVDNLIPPSSLAPAATAQPEPIAVPALPNLDINLFSNLKSKNLDDKKPDAEDAINAINIERIKRDLEAKRAKPQEIPKADDNKQELKLKISKARKASTNDPPPPIFDGTTIPGTVDEAQKKGLSDFIFIDSALDAEQTNELPNEGKRIPDLGNMIAQGRIIDAILESAIDSSIPGNIRGVVSKDVYAEVGRSVLIPKGSRLYGTYNAGAKSGRVIITWSRVIRPDGISLGIDSFASDQFGRSGILGDVDNKYGEIIASAILLSSIPLVATIATQQITGGKQGQSTTTTNAIGGTTTTTVADPINDATQKFSDQISQATQQVVKSFIDTSVVVTIPQGTRIKVMVNKDIKLPKYKTLTSLNSTITPSSQ